MIIAVSAGQYCSNKGDDFFRKKHLYLNMGLLGLCTMIKEKYAKEIIMIQGNYESCESILHKIRSICPMSGIDVLLLSIPSYYSLPWCQHFCELIRSESNVKIVVGGRWVVNNAPEWLRSKLPLIDTIIDGYGEQFLDEMINSKKTSTYCYKAVECQPFTHLDYSILYNYAEYHPSIEVARGCGAGCAFCLDSHNKRSKNKPVNEIEKEIKELKKFYPNPTVYFEAPHFRFDKDWTTEFISSLKGADIRWRCTTRIESVPVEQLKALHESGLEVIDLGLESASAQQLINMRKTNKPESYLNKANKILEECAKVGIKAKLNILFYAGETRQTVQETEKWLTSRKDLINGLSVAALIHYKNAGGLDELMSMGATVGSDSSIERDGYINLDLSADISHAVAKQIGLGIAQKIISSEDYFYLKSFSYFPNSYTYKRFLKDLKMYDRKCLPFYLD